ncbi:MAG: PIN domain-containing protein [Anaerolineales bacterium]
MIDVLIDTNLLVYIYDPSEPEKRHRAIEILQQVRDAKSGALSAQVLSEFYTTVTRKLKPPLSPAQAEAQLQAWIHIWPVFPVTSQVVLEAVRGVREYQFSFWDAQIWAAARLHHIPMVLNEDFNAGAVIEGVHFVNPFENEAWTTIG